MTSIMFTESAIISVKYLENSKAFVHRLTPLKENL